MKPLDKNYLSLQFLNKILRKNGTEFQSFFEEVMSSRHLADFQKIQPYGNQGDGGNDGYIPKEGIYYQVYAPKNPEEKEAEAAKKLKDDFEKLKANWDQISEVKAYFFVFNDKDAGVSIEIERALAELRKENLGIAFGKLTPKDLEQIFFALTEDQMLALGFDIDSKNSLKIVSEYLSKLEIELDRENGVFVLKDLENVKPIAESLNNESLLLEVELLKCRALQQNERIKEAQVGYESLIKRYPNDPRPILSLAEICLNAEDFERNKSLLEQALLVDKNHWLLRIEELLRAYRLEETVDISSINEGLFPDDPKIKSTYYRIFSLFIEKAGDTRRADSFVERSIVLNPDKYNNYDNKLSFLIGRIFSIQDPKEREIALNNYLGEIDAVEKMASEWGYTRPRNRALLNARRSNVLQLQGDVPGLLDLSQDNFELLLACHFDHLVDRLITSMMTFIRLPPEDLKKLLGFLKASTKPLSDDLVKVLVLQFLFQETLPSEGKSFFQDIGRADAVVFIDALAANDTDGVFSFIGDNLQFAIGIANTLKKQSDLRKKIIEHLPDDKGIEKDKLMLLFNFEKGDIDEAFEILKGMDLSKLGYFECKPLLEVAQAKEAWEFVVRIIEKLLTQEKDSRAILQANLQLFTAYLKLEKYIEAINIGTSILSDPTKLSLLDERNREMVLGQTIFARLRRNEYGDAKALLIEHARLLKTFDFKIAIEAEVYLRNGDPEAALSAIVEGVKIIKNPTPEQYADLFLVFTEIGNAMDFHLASLEVVGANCFVKFKDQDIWFFVGDGDELDASKIGSSNEKYALFIDKKLGEKVIFPDKFRSTPDERVIENIMPIAKYILWQCMQCAHKLTIERRWDKMQAIEVPTTPDGLDTQYLVARLEDDRQRHGALFEAYCKDNLPLAFLAVNEGGLRQAIGKISNENRGFIKATQGGQQELEKQKVAVEKAMSGTTWFIDGTSALTLSETGLLVKVLDFLPNLIVPQSVISFLRETQEKFRHIPGHVGQMGYAQGKLSFSPVDPDRRALIEQRFEDSIKALEAEPKSVQAISNATKHDCFSEQEVPGYLVDACLLAQRSSSLILTEDQLYLQANEYETHKKVPEYFSAFALMRVLYEQGKITFQEYLDFFSYLTSYRFRFLPVSTEDLEKAVFGEGPILKVDVNELRKFNLPLVLSEEYGVSFDAAFAVVAKFLVRILTNDIVLPEVIEKIFMELVSSFPAEDKKRLGKLLLNAAVTVINRFNQRLVIGMGVQEKVSRLVQLIEILPSGGIVARQRP